MSRQELIQKHIKEAQEKYAQGPLKDISFKDETLTFVYTTGNSNESQKFFLSITEDYPDSSFLFVEGSNDSRVFSGNLDEILKTLVGEYNRKYGIASSAASAVSYEYTSDEDVDLVASGTSWRTTSIESQWEDDEYTKEMSYTEHKDLTQELENYRTIWGERSVVTRPSPILETVDVELNIPYHSVLDQHVCDAWGIDAKSPLLVKLTFSSDYFLDAGRPPVVETYQTGDKGSKAKFRLKYQIEKILERFVYDHWPTNTGRAIKAEVYKPTNDLHSSLGVSRDGKEEESEKPSGKKGWFSGSGKKEKETKKKQNTKLPVDLMVPPELDQNLSQLIDMGFSVEKARNALLHSDNKLQDAAELLINKPAKCDKPPASFVPSTVSSTKKEIGNVSDLFDNPDKALTRDSMKVNVNPRYGLLVMIGYYLTKRLATLNNFCVTCDQPHVFAHGNMLKPAVCSRDLCCFAFQQLGVGSESAESIATGAEVVDLLVAFATVAANSARRDLIFDPFPQIYDQNKKPVLTPNNKDFELAKTILSKFPSVEQMSQAKDFSDMKGKMDAAHKHAFPLLQWIISSNRSHLVKLAKEKSIKKMVTPHQYLLLSAPPEKEQKFREMKKQHGSVFAFHGSSIENWHSILRHGLKNASGTKLQVNGAAYGQGIYLSPNASTSFGYCRLAGSSSPSSNNRFLSNTNINCIAICEVINKNIKKNGGIWVQPDPDCVLTRFFFVYAGTDVGSANNNNTEQADFVAEIKTAISYHGGLA